MPMIDVYAAPGTFADKAALARKLAATLMEVEGVPPIALFRENTAAFVHDTTLANVNGDSNYGSSLSVGPLGGRRSAIHLATSHARPAKRRPPVRRVRIVRSGVVGHRHLACFSAQSSAKSATSSHPSMAGSRCGPSNSTISVTVLDL